MASITLRIDGMGCGGCAARVQRAIAGTGAARVTVSRNPDRAELQLAPGQDEHTVIEAVERAGYRAWLTSSSMAEQRT